MTSEEIECQVQDFVDGVGYRRMSWHTEPPGKMLVRPEVLEHEAPEWSDWDRSLGIWTLTGTNGVARYSYRYDMPDGLMVFERASWEPS